MFLLLGIFLKYSCGAAAALAAIMDQRAEQVVAAALLLGLLFQLLEILIRL
jgi:hypothetical protein